MTNETPTNVTTGVESASFHHFDLIDADAAAFAEDASEDGEHATVLGVERRDDTTARVEYLRYESGLAESDGPAETFEINADKTTQAFACELATADPEMAVEAARDYWTGDSEEDYE